MTTRSVLLAVALLLSWASALRPDLSARQQQPTALESVLNQLTFRNVGPFRPGAWITEIAVPGERGRGDAAASGGPPPVGEYVVTLEVGGEKLSKPARIRERIRSTAGSNP